MAIQRRNTSAPALVQEPAPIEGYASGAVLHGFKDVKRAASILYDCSNSKQVPLEDLAILIRTTDNNETVDKVYRQRIKSRISAIRAFCVFCIGGQPQKVKFCIQTSCPLWPFRMGHNPFR